MLLTAIGVMIVVLFVLGCFFDGGSSDVQGEVAADAEANAPSQMSPPSYKKAAEEVVCRTSLSQSSRRLPIQYENPF